MMLMALLEDWIEKIISPMKDIAMLTIQREVNGKLLQVSHTFECSDFHTDQVCGPAFHLSHAYYHMVEQLDISEKQEVRQNPPTGRKNKCTICRGDLPDDLPTLPKLYNMSQEDKDRHIAQELHLRCCDLRYHFAASPTTSPACSTSPAPSPPAPQPSPS